MIIRDVESRRRRCSIAEQATAAAGSVPLALNGILSNADDTDVFKFRAEEGKRQYRQANPAYSYLSSNDPRAHFGLGGAAVARDVQVRWPDGSVELFGDRPAGEYHVLQQGTGQKQ